MNNLFRIYRDPDPIDDGGAAPSVDSIVDAVEPDVIPAPEVKPDVIAKVDVPPAKKFAWGDEDRRKTAQEIKDEAEIDLGYEEEKEGKKVPAKYSIKAIKEQAQWLNSNRHIIRAALGMNKEFQTNPDLKKAFETFWGNAYKDNKYNPEYVTKLNTMLEGKAEQVKEAIEDKTDDIKEMETLLQELDPDSPQAKIMRSNINGLKTTRAQLAETLKVNKAMQDKLDGLDKFKTGFEETQKQEKTAKEEQQARELFSTEFSSLTSKDKKDGYHVEDADDAKELERLTRELVEKACLDKKVTNDEQFTTAIRESAKAAFETIRTRNERIVNKYLQKKEPPKPVAPADKRETKPEASSLVDLNKLVDKHADEVFAGH